MRRKTRHRRAQSSFASLRFEPLEDRFVFDSTVVFSELMYNPASGSSMPEWIELHNLQAIDVDLGGWKIADGISYTFPTGTVIKAGGYLVVAANTSALAAATGYTTSIGPFSGALSNGGEDIQLFNNAGRLMDEFEYGDTGYWPDAPDGSGASLAKLNPGAPSALASSWSTSQRVGGTPGRANDGRVAIASLYGTGLDNNRNLLPAGSIDPHWTDSSGTSLRAAVPHPQWTRNDINSQWINPSGDGQANSPAIVFTYKTTFSLAGLDADSAVIRIQTSPDDTLQDVLLNGQSLNITQTFGALSGEYLVDSGFLTGDNQLEFRFLNTGGPTGLRAVVSGDALPIVSSAPTVAFTEVAAAGSGNFFVELANTGASAINLSGMKIVSTNGGDSYTFGSQVLAAGGLLAVSNTTLGFTPAAGHKLFFVSADGQVVTDGVLVEALGKGIAAQRDGKWQYTSAATPGTANAFALTDAIVINEIMYHHPVLPPVAEVSTTTNLIALNSPWRYNQTTQFAPGWEDVAHASGSGGWATGNALLARETAPLPDAIRTTLNLGVNTYYFEQDFNFSGNPAATKLKLDYIVDDGAVFYLNGQEIYRYNLPSGEINSGTDASTGIPDATQLTVELPGTYLLNGVNRLSVEVHQFNYTVSSDVVFGAKLDAIEVVTPAQPAVESSEEWLELYNRGNTAIDISGWELREGTEFTFAPGTVIPAGGYLIVAANANAVKAKYNITNVVGNLDGGLSNSGDHLVLVDAIGNIADEVRYGDDAPWPGLADGGGASMELRDPFADNSKPESWSASVIPQTAAWQTITYTGLATPAEGSSLNLYNELVIGLLDSGSLLIDDVSVIENPGPNQRELIQNGSFESGNADKWRLTGSFSGTVMADPDNPANKVLRIDADSASDYQSNHAETTLKFGSTFVTIDSNATYTISLRAKWLSGSPQLNTRLYFNRLSKTTILPMVDLVGTPGAANSMQVANAGPTYSGLSQEVVFGAEPTSKTVMPRAGQAVNISVNAADPQGIASMQLLYSVNGNPTYQSVAMASVGNGRYQGQIPGQADGAVVQFFVRGTDSLGGISEYPADGAHSRALYRVSLPTDGDSALHAFQIIMTGADVAYLDNPANSLTQGRVGATVVYNDEIYYDVGVRFKGSFVSTADLNRRGYNIKFKADQLFRGVQENIGFDRSGNWTLGSGGYGQDEIIVNQLNAMIGNLHGMANDLAYLVAPGLPLGPAILQMSDYNDNDYLEAAGLEDATVFNFDIIYNVGLTNPNDPESFKGTANHSITWVQMVSLGPNKESYRMHWEIENQEDLDDYSRIIAMTGVFSLPQDQFLAQVESVIDVDQWLRYFALQALVNPGDSWSTGGLPHNIKFALNPETNLVEALSWDNDFVFYGSRTAPISQNGLLNQLLQKPEYVHLYHGHLLDMLNSTYNSTFDNWIRHFQALLPTQPISGHLGYVADREAYIRGQLIGSTPFAITTNGGQNFSVDVPTVTLEGTGGIDMKEIHLGPTGPVLDVEWTTATTWRVTLPLATGPNAFTLTPFDFQGNPLPADTIVVTSTAIDPNDLSGLRISELYYHPLPAGPGETSPNSDAEDFEFVEFVNVGDHEINLAGVNFTSGIVYTFPDVPEESAEKLAPGERLVVVKNLTGFQSRFGTSVRMAPGFFTGAISNGGETIAVANRNGDELFRFTYDDAGGWPTTPDGQGPSLVVIDTAGDYNSPANWRASYEIGGSPGAEDIDLDTTAPTIISWASAGVHARGVGEAALDIPDDGTFSEPRLSGISTLLVRFSEAVDPASFVPASIGIWGNNVDSQPLDLSSFSISTALREGNTIGVITFSTKLPDYARYLIRVDSVTDVAGNPLAGDNDRLLTALLGDATGDRRVNNTDPGAVTTLRGIDPINPSVVNQVRSDVTNDGRINNTDMGGITTVRGKDARFIANPAPPEMELQVLEQVMSSFEESLMMLSMGAYVEQSAAELVAISAQTAEIEADSNTPHPSAVVLPKPETRFTAATDIAMGLLAATSNAEMPAVTVPTTIQSTNSQSATMVSAEIASENRPQNESLPSTQANPVINLETSERDDPSSDSLESLVKAKI